MNRLHAERSALHHELWQAADAAHANAEPCAHAHCSTASQPASILAASTAATDTNVELSAVPDLSHCCSAATECGGGVSAVP